MKRNQVRYGTEVSLMYRNGRKPPLLVIATDSLLTEHGEPWKIGDGTPWTRIVDIDKDREYLFPINELELLHKAEEKHTTWMDTSARAKEVADLRRAQDKVDCERATAFLGPGFLVSCSKGVLKIECLTRTMRKRFYGTSEQGAVP